MSTLSKIERELQQLIAEKKAQAAELRRRRLEPEPMSAVVDRAVKYGDGFTLEPVFELIDRLKKMPREALEARYAEEVSTEVPKTERWWLEEAIARKFQREYYLRARGVVPPSVEKADRFFRFTRPPELRVGDAVREERDVSFGVSPETRLTTGGKPCPFKWGAKWEAYQIVALAGERGVSFAELAYKLSRVLDWDKFRAERQARRMFTKWVDKNITVMRTESWVK